jgi:anti-sigma B factor antagonist
MPSDSSVRDGLLTVDQRDEGERLRLCLSGELDLSNACTAELTLEEALESKRPLLIDLSKLEFLDSTGIALLVTTLGHPEARRSQFVPSERPGVRRVLTLTGLEERLPYASVEDGRAIQPAA